MPNSQESTLTWGRISWASLVLVSLLFGVLAIFIEPLIMAAAIFALVNVALIVKYPFYGLIAYMAIFLIRPAEMLPILGALPLEKMVAGLVLLSIFLKQKLQEGSVTVSKDRLTILMFSFLAVIALSIFASYEPTQSVDQFIGFFKLFIFFYLIVTLVDSRKRFIIFVVSFILLIGYIAFDAFYAYLLGQFVHTMSVDRLSGTTSAGGDPNSMATTMVTTIPFIVAAVIYFKNSLARLFFIVLILSMCLLIVITASRGGLVAFAAVIGCGVYLTRHKALAVLAIIVLAVTAWSVMPDQYRARYERFKEISVDVNEASSGRWEIWEAGARMVAARPFLGVGAGAFPWAYATGKFGPGQWIGAHNVYVQLFATTGIIGFAVWIYFIITSFKFLGVIRRRAGPEQSQSWLQPFANGAWTIIIALLVSGMFGHSLYRYTWYVCAALVVVMWKLFLKSEDNASDDRSIASVELAPASVGTNSAEDIR